MLFYIFLTLDYKQGGEKTLIKEISCCVIFNVLFIIFRCLQAKE